MSEALIGVLIGGVLGWAGGAMSVVLQQRYEAERDRERAQRVIDVELQRLYVELYEYPFTPEERDAWEGMHEHGPVPALHWLDFGEAQRIEVMAELRKRVEDIPPEHRLIYLAALRARRGVARQNSPEPDGEKHCAD